MNYKRILTVQDISCVGQCSLTVALPILSACGLETCILPSAILSTHTAGFTGYTCRDLTEDFPDILNHWKKEKIQFDAVYTGYLGSTEQIDLVLEIINNFLKPNGISIVDPAMADNGKLYPAFDNNYVEAMKKLCASAHIVIPNITEADFLIGKPYLASYTEDNIKDLLREMSRTVSGTCVLTGIGYKKGKTGIALYEDGKYSYYEHNLIPKGSHGTGDVYASAFVGALLNDKNTFEAAKIAADYTVKCIENTQGDDSHWYGVKFEPVLGELISMINN